MDSRGTITMQQALAELRTLDPAQIQDALGILVEYDDPEVTEAIVDVLPRLDTSKRLAASVASDLVRELTRRKDARVVELAIALLNRDLDASGDDHQLQSVACDAFRALNAEQALPYLQQALMSKRWVNYEEDVADALAALGGAKVEDVLLEALAARRPELKLAAVRALRIAGTARSLPALEKAAKSSNTELKVAALGTLCVLQPERANEIVDKAISAAGTTYPLQGDVVRLIRDIISPDMSSRLVPLVSQPAWKAVRFQILALLVDRKSPEARALVRASMNEPEGSLWSKAHAAALLLEVDYSDELVALLLEALRQSYQEDRDFHLVNDAGEAIVRSLVAATPRDMRRHVEVVELLDAIRRERFKSFPRGRWVAADVVRQIVGSDEFSDYDAWIAKHRV